MESFHPGKKTLLFSILCAFLSTKNGRNLGAEIFHKHIKLKLLFCLPLSLRCKIVLAVMNMPLKQSRMVMYLATRPWGAQWDAITKISKEGWSGHWIAPQARSSSVEHTAKEADLIIYFIHGGGFRVGHSLMYTDSFMRIIHRLKEKGMDARIFSIDYGLCPEVQFDRSKQDCMDGYRYLVKELQIDPKRIVLMGDSAGGNLVIHCCSEIGKSGVADDLEPPAGNVQISPWVNIDTSETIRDGVVYEDCLNRRTFDRMDHGEYYGCRTEMDKEKVLRDASISPMYGTFVGLCPTLVTYGSTEVFQDDVQRMIEVYRRDGVSVDVVKKKAPHIWIICNMLSPNDRVWKEGCSVLADWCAKCV
ncbi:hypothetical protein INT47_003480 [Mucor saturninus]|uniref:Alpha/beta hydrolase fold-3 domain-containing protein n=1 Tax=Mucor saturninus TaxID=64648 RepID=A0A8H7REP3_9FUNG|nr:hypothetical protein INT47_003480 [Mucor saturninus]